MYTHTQARPYRVHGAASVYNMFTYMLTLRATDAGRLQVGLYVHIGYIGLYYYY